LTVPWWACWRRKTLLSERGAVFHSTFTRSLPASKALFRASG